MKLVDMKKDPVEQKKSAETMCVDKSLYPYGLCVDLSEESIEKLGIDKLPDVDTAYTLTAKVTVSNVGDRKNADGRYRNMSLQIEAMALSDAPADEGKSDADKLYKS